MMSFIFMNRGTVKDHCGGIGLNIVLRHKEKQKLPPYPSQRLQLMVHGAVWRCMILPWSRGCGGWCSPEYQTSSVQPTGLKLFSAQAVKLDMEDTTAHKNKELTKMLSNNGYC